MRSIIIISLLALGCTNDVPPDSAPEVPAASSTPAEHGDTTGTSSGSTNAESNNTSPPPAPVDEDGDGFAADNDCNDQDASINPEAIEVCDGIDNDCDGVTDPSTSEDSSVWYRDADGDGFDTDIDCDDMNAAVYPGAVEACDFEDSDCDGSVADEFDDADGDDLPDCVDEDSDDDGLPDAFEEDIGLDPEDATDASSDEDGDGRTALEEFEAGSDPTVYEGPGTPSPYLPEDGGEMNSLPAVLVVVDADAPLDQPLTHGMLLALDETLETVEGSGTPRARRRPLPPS